MRLLSNQVKDHAGKSVEIQGWLHKKRAMGGLMFVVVRDRGGLVQVVVKDEAEQERLRGLQVGTVVKVKGHAKADDRASGGAEIHDPEITVIVAVEDEPLIEIDKPIDHTAENQDTLFEHRAINLRNQTEGGIFKVQAAVDGALRGFFESEGFLQVHSPKLLAAATEGGAEVFKLDYFGQQATLAQSPQFYKQMLVGAFERVYEIGPVYRAEPSMTTRHLSEYISVDAEMGFIESFDDVMQVLGDLMHSVSKSVWESCEAELKALGATPPKLFKQLPSLTLEELHQLYSKATGEDTTKEKDPTPAEERWACEWSLKEHGSEAIFISEFPASEMKFYHYKDPRNPNVAVRTDLLFRGVEIVTGSQREHRYDVLVNQLKAIGGDPEHPGFKYFLQAFRYGMPPHGGFGLGLERLTQKLCGLRSVKEASLFPRDMQRLTP